MIISAAFRGIEDRRGEDDVVHENNKVLYR